MEIPGIHHVTAIAGDAQRNIDFYVGVLGLRLVKLTVNHDHPSTFHLYYGDEAGSPGSLLTFFIWPGAVRGRTGAGMAASVGLAIPPDATGYWEERLARRGFGNVRGTGRDGEEVVRFRDPDGLALDLVSHPRAGLRPAWEAGPVLPRCAVRGIHGVTFYVGRLEETGAFLTGRLGLRDAGSLDGRSRFECGDGGPGTVVDVSGPPFLSRGAMSAGTVHHVAFRARGEAEQRACREKIAASGVGVTPVVDRTYFRSIYFREPGGVLLEVATEGPGFTIDEPLSRLGSSLKLPPTLEPIRDRLARRLPPLRLPKAA